MNDMPLTGRFAPSPTGPLHFGSLVAAVGSWLFARAAGGRWLVRMEDLDTPRVIPGADRWILDSLQAYGLEWDGEVAYQSQRIDLYDAALRTLRTKGFVFDCACSRADLQRAASAPDAVDANDGRIYAGTCRSGIAPGKIARAVRFRVPPGVISFHDAVCGEVAEEVSTSTGDFVVRRADGLFAYQLAVVVDDAEQGVTQVVRGSDLLTSTARQIALQRALGLPTPEYAHLPLIVRPDGSKLGKRGGALSLAGDSHSISRSLAQALQALGCDAMEGNPRELLDAALASFTPARIPRDSIVVDEFPGEN